MPTLDPITLQRLYTRPKSLTPQMVLHLANDHLLVEPVLPPNQTTSGIQLQQGEVPGTAAIAFRVLGRGFQSYDWPMGIDAGDVLIVRNAMLEPIHPAMDILVIEAKHVLAKLDLPTVPEGA